MSAGLYAIILGIIQGLTEFLPVSSSGHIEIANYIMGSQYSGEDNMLLTVILHFATALSTIVVFRKDIWEIIQGILQKKGTEERAFAAKIILSMIPAVFVGLVFEDAIESLFTGNILLVGAMLLITAVLLYMADKKLVNNQSVAWGQSLVIGVAQAIAILPGISRSGATIATSVLLGVDRVKAARFSFLMVVPLIFGKMMKDLLDGDVMSSQIEVTSLVLGFMAAFVTGILACTWMINLVKKSNLKYFAFYCMIVGLFAIIYSLV